MSDEQVDLENESQTDGASQPGNAGRVFLTLLMLALAGVTVAFAFMKDGKFFQNLLAQDEWTSQMIGNLHPILIMLPLGLIVMVVLLEIFGWLSFGNWKPSTVAALFFVVLTAVLASLSGLFLMELEGNTGPDWTNYLWYGIGATVAFTLAFICKIWGSDGNSRGLIYAVFLLGGTAVLGYGGYVFGQKVHSFALVPSHEDPATPFGNQKKMAMMKESLVVFEASTAELEKGVALKDEKIAELTAASQAAEENFSNEQKKVALAEKSMGELKEIVATAQKNATELQTKMAEAEKKATEADTKIQAISKEKEALQQEINNLKTQMEALKKEGESEQPEEAKEEEKPVVE